MVATHQEQIRKLDELIRGIDVAMLTTATPEGGLRSRPLGTLKEPFDGTLWFFTHAPTPKTREIREDEHVNLAYADPGRGVYVSMAGRARIVRDPELAARLWRPELGTWFPKGPAEDPDLALLRVEATEAEYWDLSAGAVVRLAGAIRSAVTGRGRTGENEKIQVSG